VLVAVLCVGSAAATPQVVGAPAATANPVLVVTSPAGAGPHTLRALITKANATPGPDRIAFGLGGASPHVITPASSLPEITETVTIDGATQPGFRAATHRPVVVLDGSAAGFSAALRVSGTAAGGTELRGLEIVDWQLNAIVVVGAADVVIAGNYVGTDGRRERGNGVGFQNLNGAIVEFGESRNLRIGGTTPADRNVISGNRSSQVYLTDAVGATIQGNYVGTNAAGTAKIPQGGHGLFLESDGGVVIGGAAPGAGNVISGNIAGLVLGGIGYTVQGNRIGTNAAGTAAVPNSTGITGGWGDTVIGGTTAGARNLVSGNGIGIDLYSAVGASVEGNRIGTNAAGTAAIPNDVGVHLKSIVDDTHDNRIGGAERGAGNLISGNRIGIQIDSGTGTRVQGNLIGTRADGSTPLPNTDGGILVRNDNTNGNLTTGTVIGGLVPGAGNVIAFNGGTGVAVAEDTHTEGTSIRGNSIQANDGLGIDLEPDQVAGLTPNDDDDADTGPNGLQNFPGIAQAISAPGGTTVFGTLESTPNSLFRLDVYASDRDPAGGHRNAAVYVGTVQVPTDAGGNGSFGATFPLVLGNFVSATATSGGGDTSELSSAVRISGPGGFRFAMPAISVGEGAGHVTLTVKRVGGTEGAVTVQFATADGTARAPVDYHATSGTLHFAAGQVARPVTIPIANDALHEGAESFTVRLSDPGGGAALGSPTTARVTIRASD
jgi:hypothetical protein